MFGFEASVPEEVAEPAVAGRRPDGGRALLVIGGICLLGGLFWVLLDLPALVRARGTTRERYFVNLTEPGPAEPLSPLPETAAAPLLRLAVAPAITPEKSLADYRPLVDYLAAQTGRSPVLLECQTDAEVMELLRHRRCELALVGVYAFVRGERELGLRALAVPRLPDAAPRQSLIVVSQTSPAASLLHLKGRRFASKDYSSYTGWLYPALWLMERQQEPERFFGRHLLTGSHDRTLEAVASGYVDGGAVDSLVYRQWAKASPQAARGIRVLQSSPPAPLPPLVAPARLPDELRQALGAALLTAHEEKAGRRALAGLGFERLVAPETASYDSVRQAADTWESRRP